MPGMFWVAIVTMNSGTAIPMTEATEKLGVVQTGVAIHCVGVSVASPAFRTTTAAAATTAAGTANRRLIRPAMNHVRITGKACHGRSTAA